MTILMSSPHHFDVTYEINPWMKETVPVSKTSARAQWSVLFNTINKHATVTAVPPVSHPDFVFTANAGLVREKEVILSSFKHAERKKEEPYWEAWFQQAGYTVHTLTHVSFEGAGDALFSNKHTLIGGYGFRTDQLAYDQIQQIWNITILQVELVDPRFYHLDTCLCVLNEHTIMYYPAAFSAKSRKQLETQFHCIAVEETEALQFACNAVVLEKTIILPTGTPQIQKELITLGFHCREVEMTEFLKSGGAAKCLTLAL